MKRLISLLLAALLTLALAGCARKTQPSVPTEPAQTEEIAILPVVPAETSEDAEQPPAEAPPAQSPEETPDETLDDTPDEPDEPALDEGGSYTTKEDVALYIHLYGHLPSNFITKKQAEALGWPGGSLEPYAPGKCIGGGRFGNYEGLLPEADGRKYTECDIDTLGRKSRGAKRIVFSNDGLIYYTEDHYESFELLYGEE